MVPSASNEFCVVLDACVLAPMPLCDTLLRYAEENPLFHPKWSADTLVEVRRTLVKFGRSEIQIERRLHFMRAAFPEACVQISPRQLLTVPAIPDPSDKHVIAAAIQERAQAIVSFNLRHFPAAVLKPYGIGACSPDQFLVREFLLSPPRMLKILDMQAEQIRQGRGDVLGRLKTGLPRFVALLEAEIAR